MLPDLVKGTHFFLNLLDRLVDAEQLEDPLVEPVLLAVQSL